MRKFCERFFLIFFLSGCVIIGCFIGSAERANANMVPYDQDYFNRVVKNGQPILIPNYPIDGVTSIGVFNSGAFTDAQMNLYSLSAINALNFTSEFQLAEGGHGTTEAFSGGVFIPSSATVLQAEGVGGYAVNSSTTTFGFGGYFQSRCAANSVRCGGINPVVLDTTGLTTSLTMYGADLVVAPRNANTAYSIVEGYSASLAGPSNAQGYGQAFDASTQATSFWNFAFRSRDGAATTALQAGAACTSGSCSSQPIGFTSMSGGVAQSGNFFMTQSGLLNFNSPSTNGLQLSDGAHNNTATVASGTAVMTTAAIASGACGTTVTVAATGAATTDVISVSRNASVATPNGLLTLNWWPTANNVNFNYCNTTASSQTPASATVNWSIGR